MYPHLSTSDRFEVHESTWKEFFKILSIGIFFFSSVIYITYGVNLTDSNYKEIKECKDSFLLAYLISYFCVVFLRMILVLYLQSRINLVPSKIYKYNCFIILYICLESLYAGWEHSQFESKYCIDGYPSDIWNFGYITYLIQIFTILFCIILTIGINLFVYCHHRDDYNYYFRQRSFPIIT